MGIPLATAAHAQQHPLDAHDGRKACAQALDDSIYGAHAAHRNSTLHDQDVKILADDHAQAHFDNINRAYEKLRLNPQADPAVVQKAYQGAVAAGKQLEAANVARQKAYQAYQQLPEEADALGDRRCSRKNVLTPRRRDAAAPSRSCFCRSLPCSARSRAQQGAA